MEYKLKQNMKEKKMKEKTKKLLKLMEEAEQNKT